MREIKFRVWGTSNEHPAGKMYYPGDLPIVINLFGNPIHAPNGNLIEKCCYMRVGWNDVDLMEWTGLKDKNGKEIYEGDIVECVWDGFQEKSEVFFDFGCFSIKAYNNDPGYQPCIGLIPEEDIKVVGNIHETPELLK